MNPENQCRGKRRFRSHARALNFIGKNFMSLALPNLQAYLCPQCKGFHIGHNASPDVGGIAPVRLKRVADARAARLSRI